MKIHTAFFIILFSFYVMSIPTHNHINPYPYVSILTFLKIISSVDGFIHLLTIKDPTQLKDMFHSIDFGSMESLNLLSFYLKKIIQSENYHFYDQGQMETLSQLVLELITKNLKRIEYTMELNEWNLWSSICKDMMEILSLTNASDSFIQYFTALEGLDILDLRIRNFNLKIQKILNFLPTGSFIKSLASKGQSRELELVLNHYMNRMNTEDGIYFFSMHMQDFHKQLHSTFTSNISSDILNQLKIFVESLIHHITSDKSKLSMITFEDNINHELSRLRHLISL